MFADDILGDFEKRYFGAGHKRTNYKLKEADEYGKAEITHTNNWSEKMGCSLKPHLSAVDGIILSVMYVEKYMIDKKFIDLNNMFLYSFEIKSGTCAIEDLKDISLEIRYEEILSSEAYFEVSVESMIVRLKFKKVNIQLINDECNTEEKKYNYISEHLKRIKHNIFGIEINGDEIACTVSREKIDDVSYNGIGSMLSNCMSILEWLIVFSQMGQILAYDIDSINRQSSETLWMKNVKAEIVNPIEYKGDISVSGGVTKKNLVNMKSNTWRIFEMAGSSADGNVQFQGKIAHILPDGKKEVVYA